MEMSPDFRAAQVVKSLSPAGCDLSTVAPQLQSALAAAIREAVATSRAGLHTTLRLCLQAFNDILDLKGLPGPSRAVLRVCRTLCAQELSGLPGYTDEGSATEENEGDVVRQSRRSVQ